MGTFNFPAPMDLDETHLFLAFSKIINNDEIPKEKIKILHNLETSSEDNYAKIQNDLISTAYIGQNIPEKEEVDQHASNDKYILELDFPFDEAIIEAINHLPNLYAKESRYHDVAKILKAYHLISRGTSSFFENEPIKDDVSKEDLIEHYLSLFRSH